MDIKIKKGVHTSKELDEVVFLAECPFCHQNHTVYVLSEEHIKTLVQKGIEHTCECGKIFRVAL